jgi:hypothetical protein
LLSFPRFRDDFISKKYNEAVADKEVISRSHEFIVNPELPEDATVSFASGVCFEASYLGG